MPGFGYNSFDFMFTAGTIFIGIIFVIMLVVIISGIVSQAKDRQKPVIPVRATVVAKRTRVSGGSHTGEMHTHASTYYYATFELENGERLEMRIPSDEIGYIIEGDRGILSFQGNLFVKFERSSEV